MQHAMLSPPIHPIRARTKTEPCVAIAAPEVPSVRSVLVAIAGLGAFGLTTGLGLSRLAATPLIAALPIAAFVGTIALSGPALVAGHLWLRPAERTEVPIAALGRGLVDAGSVAGGLAPVALFLVATTGLWAAILAIGSSAIGVAAVVGVLRVLLPGAPTRGSVLFAIAWVGLAALVAIRIAIAVGSVAWEVVR